MAPYNMEKKNHLIGLHVSKMHVNMQTGCHLTSAPSVAAPLHSACGRENDLQYWGKLDTIPAQQLCICRSYVLFVSIALLHMPLILQGLNFHVDFRQLISQLLVVQDQIAGLHAYTLRLGRLLICLLLNCLLVCLHSHVHAR